MPYFLDSRREMMRSQRTIKTSALLLMWCDRSGRLANLGVRRDGASVRACFG